MARYCPECSKPTLTLDSSGYECSECGTSGDLNDLARLASEFDFKTGKRLGDSTHSDTNPGEEYQPSESTEEEPEGWDKLVDLESVLQGKKLEPNCQHCGTQLVMRVNENFAQKGGTMFRVLCLKCKKFPCATMGCTNRAVDIVPNSIPVPTNGPPGINGVYPDALPVCKGCKEGWLKYKRLSKYPRMLVGLAPLFLAYAFFEYRFPLVVEGGILQALLLILSIGVAIAVFVFGWYQWNQAAVEVPVLRKPEYVVPASWTGSTSIKLFPAVKSRFKRVSRLHRSW